MALSILAKFNIQKKSWKEINEVCKKHFSDNVDFFPIDAKLNSEYHLLGISINSKANKERIMKLIMDIEKNGGNIKELYNGKEFRSIHVQDFFE